MAICGRLRVRLRHKGIDVDTKGSEVESACIFFKFIIHHQTDFHCPSIPMLVTPFTIRCGLKISVTTDGAYM